MPILKNAKQEHFAQNCAKGLNATKAYLLAGYSKLGAQSGGSRLFLNVLVSARIKELTTAITERVIASEIRRRSWRVQVLQSRLDKMLAFSEARAKMYAAEMGESHQVQVANFAEEQAALAEGCTFLAAPPVPPTPRVDWNDAPPPVLEYPKTMVHPGYPNGAATGLLVKDYRGRDANQVVWKFDASLESRITETLKQAAIEEGQWSEKRDPNAERAFSQMKANINRGRDRLAAEKAAALARGEVWH
jgi:hypothetical protein